VIESAGVHYMQARMQARLGTHPNAAEWQRIEAARSLGAALAAARATTFFKGWIAGLGAASSSHEIELGLRLRLRGLVNEVAGWMPLAWRQACLWIGVLIDLPVLFHLSRGREPLPWMRGDLVLKNILECDPSARQQAIQRGILAPLAQHWSNASAVRQAWIAEWRRRWPRSANHGTIDRLVSLIEHHLEVFPGIAPEFAWSARADLHTALRRLLHRSVLHPAGAFCYLALAAIEVERLRASLVRCALFPSGETA
jgi:hypothetical protein